MGADRQREAGSGGRGRGRGGLGGFGRRNHKRDESANRRESLSFSLLMSMTELTEDIR